MAGLPAVIWRSRRPLAREKPRECRKRPRIQKLGAQGSQAAGARAQSQIVAQCVAVGARGGEAGDEMHRNPKFWALAVGLFVLLCLALVNIIEKVNMLVHLTENG
ncbi:hypothetical protein DSM21852_20790 [Methylocystis bryophila]|uniref:Uncharacterized protein n=1 Tax=Methylocystis bryophila TaxID=655015 RepID=A0A1W6MYH2_9HYPH|nr:hypothetical protein B1812_17665 [Methylocystis bryophila]BDV38826.1 hypothetical protein DSM21852_20790 [Methylocystis bryophila]